MKRYKKLNILQSQRINNSVLVTFKHPKTAYKFLDYLNEPETKPVIIKPVKNNDSIHFRKLCALETQVESLKKERRNLKAGLTLSMNGNKRMIEDSKFLLERIEAIKKDIDGINIRKPNNYPIIFQRIASKIEYLSKIYRKPDMKRGRGAD